MADIDIDTFGQHDKTDSHSDETGETIPLTPEGVMGGGSAWEPECKQETSFGRKSHESEIVKEEQIEEFYQLLGNKTYQRLEPHLDLFKVGEDGVLYYRAKSLMNRNGEQKRLMS